MSITEAPIYSPKAGSVPARVIAFFQANPDEELTRLDVAQKFDVPSASVDECLAIAVARECLAKSRNSEAELVWKIGRRKAVIDSADVSKEARRNAKPVSSPFALAAAAEFDPASITVRKGVSLKTPEQQLEEKFNHLFETFDVGDSAEFEAQWEDLLQAACRRYCKASKRRFVFVKTAADKVGMERKA